jgi:hypothetical protein
MTDGVDGAFGCRICERLLSAKQSLPRLKARCEMDFPIERRLRCTDKFYETGHKQGIAPGVSRSGALRRVANGEDSVS